jgi:hypothetical protein
VKEMQSANLSGPLKGLRPYHALLGLTQASGFAGGFDFFMKFCNLAILNFREDVPLHIRFNALRIAMRIIMKIEAMDFFLNPRGVMPEEVGKRIHAPKVSTHKGQAKKQHIIRQLPKKQTFVTK